jgi:hypothetical protein
MDAKWREYRMGENQRPRGGSIKGHGAPRAQTGHIRWRLPSEKGKNHHALAKYRHSRANP